MNTRIRIKTVFAFVCLTMMVSLSAQGATITDLIAFYDFNGNANDTSGNGYDATLVGGAAISADTLGYSGSAGDRSLDVGSGTTEYADVTGATKLGDATAANRMAVSFWQYNIGNGTGGNINNSSFRVVGSGSGNAARGFQAHSPWSDGTFYFDHGGACCNAPNRLTTSVGTTLLDGWHHIALQVDNGTKEIWIDGSLKNSQASGAAAIPTLTNQILIGRDDVNYFHGRIDEFAVLSDTLTQDQIESLAGGTPTLEVIPEPATMGLLALGGVGLLRRRRS